MAALRDMDAQRFSVFANALRRLEQAQIPFVVGGAFALGHYTGIWRDTKDMDLFLQHENVGRAVQVLGRMGFRHWIEAQHWLGKCQKEDSVVDLIFGFGNWLASVDRPWIERAQNGELFGVPVLIAPVEELILSKAYVAHRERFDGADVVHLLRASKGRLDWHHLLSRFGEHWELLLAYLLLFRFVYPSDRKLVPERVMELMVSRLQEQLRQPAPSERITRGPLLDRYQFIFDIDSLGYHDPREELAMAQGYSREAVIKDRQVARRMLETGQVRSGAC